MSYRVKTALSTEKLKRAYGLTGQGRRYLAQQVRQRCDKYVPKDTGLLKNTAVVSPSGETITYVQPYARKQFYVNYRHRDPKRGDHWHRRMLQMEGRALAAELGRYLERRPGE